MPRPKKAVSIVDRRLASGSVFAASSRPIPLVDPQAWELRIVNTQISEQRLWEIQADKGWVYADEADIAIPVSEIGFRVQDGRIVRGTQGAEVLMKMPKGDYQRIQAAKTDENKRRTFGQKQNKADILAAAAGPDGVGAEGADFLARNLHHVNIADGRELVSLDD